MLSITFRQLNPIHNAPRVVYEIATNKTEVFGVRNDNFGFLWRERYTYCAGNEGKHLSAPGEREKIVFFGGEGSKNA